MIFKNNVKIREEEILLLKALVQSNTIDSLIEQLPDYEDDIYLVLNSLSSKLSFGNTLEDLMFEIINLRKIIIEKDKVVKKQKYEEAAKARDNEKASYGRINLGFKLEVRKKELDSYINNLQEYFIYRDAIISENSTLNLLIQPGTATKEDIGSLLSELSKLYRMLGGTGINFKLEGIRNPKYRFDYE